MADSRNFFDAACEIAALSGNPVPERSAHETAHVVPQGSVRMGLTVEGQVALSRVVCHWTKGEAAALLAGDPEAREKLKVQAMALIMKEGRIEIEWTEVWANSSKLVEVGVTTMGDCAFERYVNEDGTVMQRPVGSDQEPK